MNRIAEKARALGLVVTANALSNATLDPDGAPRDARLTEPPAQDIKRILGQMARRGCERHLIRALWSKLDGRPLERALVAVDVLAQAVVWPGDRFVDELRVAADSLGAARPPSSEVGVDLSIHSAQALIELRRGDSSVSTVELLTRAYQFDLAALDQLHARNDDVVARLATRDSIHAFARLASLARLPTLASVYLDWLVRGLGWPVAALELCETLFDAGVAHKIPGDVLKASDLRGEDKQATAEYLLYRSHLSVGDTDTAHALLLHNIAQRARWTGGASLRVDVVQAHLGILYGQRDVPVARVEMACALDSLWRYGSKVRAIVAAKREPTRAVEFFHGYLAGFGHDFDCAFMVLSLLPQNGKRDIGRILCREAYYLPHEPAPWKLLGSLFGFGDEVTQEVDQHLRMQSMASSPLA
jgi:hypothetical protein